MSYHFPFLIAGIILAFVTGINYNNWGTTHNEQWYWLSWATLVTSLTFIIISFCIDRKVNYKITDTLTEKSK